MRARPEVCAVLLGAAVALACQSAPPPSPPPKAGAAAGMELFDSDRAWRDLEAFAAIGPRVMGSDGAARARRYIVSELGDAGLQTERLGVRVEREGEPVLRLENVAAVISGESSDLMLLVAPYDTRPYSTFQHQGVNEGGSGAAVLLELARSLARQQLSYTVWFVFLEGEAPHGEDALAEPSHFGSQGLAQRLVELDAIPHIRLGVVIDRVCDADLEIARDLGSHRIYREEFWRAAGRLGRSEAFPRTSGFQSPRSSQEALRSVGLERVVTLSDTSFGGDEPPGLYAGSEDDTIERCSPESLETVGLVTLEGINTISRRLARIDRFSRSPVEGAEALRLEQLRDDETSGAGAESAVADGELPAGGGEDATAEGQDAADAQDSPEAPDAGDAQDSPEAPGSAAPPEQP
jgi:glutaminyl-peptide cyclotransferase